MNSIQKSIVDNQQSYELHLPLHYLTINGIVDLIKDILYHNEVQEFRYDF